APGLVDMHVHLREPGQTHKEDIASGTLAAAAGGVTTVLAMPNTAPATDSAEVVTYVRTRPATVKVEVCGAVTVGLGGKEASGYAAMKAAGAVALSDDGRPVQNAAVMKNAMLEAKKLGMLVCDHCEELALPGADSASEAILVARDIALAEETGCPVHICHVSAKDTVRILRDAKAAGVPVTAETAPHYFTLIKDDVRGSTNAKMNPPLRGAEDRAAVIEGLKDGTLDVIITDHAPHAAEEKAQPFDKAPNGIVGLETSLALGITELVEKGVLTLPELIEKMSTTPARLLGLPRGTLEVGAEADLVLFGAAEEWTVDPEKLHSKSKNTPYAGRTVRGRVKYTVVSGEVVYVDR
ncbi:MAG TPA: dihydroorotase, partial [Terriglobales bacterium]|nr:dihydroorotase [Terriglobales bacterium]